MALSIKQYNGKWRIAISNEEWEFKDLKEFKENLNKIIDLKDKFGHIEKGTRTGCEK